MVKILRSLFSQIVRSNFIPITMNQAQFMKPMDSLKSEDLLNFVSDLQAVLFDCDGVLWRDSFVLRDSNSLVKLLRTLGKKVFFVTNNSTKTREEFLVKFKTLGFEASIDEIISSSYLAALYLKEQKFDGKVYTIGTAGVTQELSLVGIPSLPIGPDNVNDISDLMMSKVDVQLDPDVKAVIVAYDPFYSLKKCLKAASYLEKPGVHFIATNTDERFPGPLNIIIPGTGCIVNSVKTAAEREPVVIGKPSELMFDFIKKSYNLDPEKTLMVGDRGNTDILFGRNCNLWTLLVLTGVTSLDEATKWVTSDKIEERNCVPNFYLNEIGDLYDLLLKNSKALNIE